MIMLTQEEALKIIPQAYEESASRLNPEKMEEFSRLLADDKDRMLPELVHLAKSYKKMMDLDFGSPDIAVALGLLYIGFQIGLAEAEKRRRQEPNYDDPQFRHQQVT